MFIRNHFYPKTKMENGNENSWQSKDYKLEAVCLNGSNVCSKFVSKPTKK